MMRQVKSISFDLSDEFERGLLNHAEKNGKFSRYIKRLIQRDKDGIKEQPVIEPQIEEPENIDSFF